MFLAFLICLVASFAAVQIRFGIQRRRLMQEESWKTVLDRIKPVDVAGIGAIADAYLHPSSSQLSIEPWQMWEAFGGLAGIEDIWSNAAAMLDLAVYASRWNTVEGRVISEMIRRDGVALRRAVRRIRLASLLGPRSARTPFQLQEAAASYCLMRGRLLGLYQVVHVGLYPRLAEVL